MAVLISYFPSTSRKLRELLLLFRSGCTALLRFKGIQLAVQSRIWQEVHSQFAFVRHPDFAGGIHTTDISCDITVQTLAWTVSFSRTFNRIPSDSESRVVAVGSSSGWGCPREGHGLNVDECQPSESEYCRSVVEDRHSGTQGRLS